MASEIQGRAIFISYRRDDSEGEAGRLYDDLVRAYGDASVFMDVAGIDPGLDFRKAIDANVASCGVLLAMIGPTWGTVTDAEGKRRLDNPNDFVRLEIASALARGVAVIPVLVHGAKMPPLDLLPDDLKDLRYRNSVEITHARWNSDVALLIGALKNYVSVNSGTKTETVHATIPVQLPAPDAPVETPKSKSYLPLGVAAATLLVVLAGVFAYLHFHHAAVSPGSALIGKWKNVREKLGDDDLAQLSIADFDGQLVVDAWGKCPDRACDWGSRKASLNGTTAVTESWLPRNTPNEIQLQRSATLSIEPNAGGLQVTIHNLWQMPNGQTKELYNPQQFAKMP